MSDDTKKPEDLAGSAGETAEETVASAAEDTVASAEDTVSSAAEGSAPTAGDAVSSFADTDTDARDYAEETNVDDLGEKIMASANEKDADKKSTESFTEKETIRRQTENRKSYDTEPDVSIPVRRKKRSKAIHLAWIIPAAAAAITIAAITAKATFPMVASP